MDILINRLGNAVVLINNGTDFVETPLESFADSSCRQGPFLPLSVPHSSAFVDLNGDCLADLFLTVSDPSGQVYFQVWLNAKNGKYCLAYHEPAPEGAGQVAMVDVDKNGMDDLVFPMGTNQIYILFNDNHGTEDCRFSPDRLDEFTLPDMVERNSSQWAVINLTANYSLYEGGEEFPLTLRFADVDLDGYPDLLVSLYNEELKRVEAVFFSNTNSGSRRTFEQSHNSEYHKLLEVPSIVSTFIDLNENSIMDILLTARNDDGSVSVVSFYNNLIADTFHLKALMFDGDSINGGFPGAVFTFDVTDLDMNRITRRCTQSPQTAWFALLPPYCLAGTGRTVSYIENFNAALPFAKHSSRMWTPIIPNSDLLVLPTPDNTDDWSLQLFANPSDSVVYVIAVSVIVLAVLGAFIIWRLREERKRDAKTVKFS